MKSTPWLALAAAFAGSAVACGFYILRHPEAAWAANEAASKTNLQAGGRSRTGTDDSADSVGKHFAAPGENHRTGSQTASRGSLPMPLRKALAAPPSGGNPVLSEAQWRANAAKVELEANHELDRLVGLLNLDSAQQAKIFASLARQSSHWVPGMQIDGGQATGSGTAGQPVAVASDVSDFLSAEQQQTLLQEESDRLAWWEEVLPQLLPPTLPNDATVTSPPESSTSADASTGDAGQPPETKQFEDDGRLLEE
ncbi:MAG: hypothetical protein NTW21_10055 [Verrucomicrobia bacterium]|nr:hypothetical protein [Verrucomicrobiota bacterium]